MFGVAASGTHAVVFLVLPLLPVMTLIWARKHVLRRCVFSVLALAIMAAGPVTYYATFSRWFTDAGGLTHAKDDGTRAEHDNGLMWIEGWQSDRTPGNLLLSCLSDYAFAYEWPPEEQGEPNFRQPLPEWGGDEARYLAQRAMWVITAALLAGAVAWPLLRCGPSLGMRRRDTGRWLALATLTIGAVLYGVYLRSFRELLPPWEAPWWAYIAVAAVAGWCVLMSRTWRVLLWLAGSVGMLVCLWAAAKGLYAIAPKAPNGQVIWNPLWMPRYTAVVLPMMLVFAAALLSQIPTKVLRWSAVAAVLCINLSAALLRVLTLTEFPNDLYAQDAVTAWQPDGPRQTLVCTADGGLGTPMWRRGLPGAYCALAQAASLSATPGTFREGNTWPYIPGTAVRQLLTQYRAVSYARIAAEADRQKATRIILWLVNTPPDSTIERTLEQRGWRQSSETAWQIRHIWTWTKQERVRRVEFTRTTSATQPTK
jgi:hypothetical protein